MQEKMSLSSVLINLKPVKFDVTLSSEEWSIICSLQNEKQADVVLKNSGINKDLFLEYIKNMINIGIIKLEKKQSDVVKKNIPDVFWQELEQDLSKYIGPIAGTVIDDELENINTSKSNTSIDDLYILIDSLSQEINNQTDKVNFQKKMIQLIKTF